MSEALKKGVVGLIFLAIYIGGVTAAWTIPAFKDGLSLIFAFAWFFVTSKFVSYLAARFGWTKAKE